MSQKKSDKPEALIRQYERKIKTALKADVDYLFKDFAKGPFTYEFFLQCYREADFWTIFIGRFSPSDECEFAEDFFHYVVSFIFPNELRAKKDQKKNSMPEVLLAETEKNEQLFGIFLSYTAFFMQAQTDVRLIPLRLELAEYLPQIMFQLQQERQLQPLYCLQRLISAKAFMIIPFDEDYNPLLQNRFRNIDEEESASLLINDFERLKNVSESQDLKYLAEINEKYEAMKKKFNLPKEFSQPTNDLNSTIQNLSTEAQEKYNNVPTILPPKTSTSILDQLSQLRKKAEEQDVVIPRHRRHKHGLGFYDMAPVNLHEINDDNQPDDLPTSSTSGMEKQTDKEQDIDESESPTGSSAKSKRGRAKKTNKFDHLQAIAKSSITRANKKHDRIRRETVTEEGEEPTSSELLRREVEADLELQREKQTKRRSPRKSRTESTATSTDSPTIGSTRRRSQRLSKTTPAPTPSISRDEATTEVTQKAIEALHSGSLADMELNKLKAKKK